MIYRAQKSHATSLLHCHAVEKKRTVLCSVYWPQKWDKKYIKHIKYTLARRYSSKGLLDMCACDLSTVTNSELMHAEKM